MGDTHKTEVQTDKDKWVGDLDKNDGTEWEAEKRSKAESRRMKE